jgi:hypothetical protein
LIAPRPAFRTESDRHSPVSSGVERGCSIHRCNAQEPAWPQPASVRVRGGLLDGLPSVHHGVHAGACLSHHRAPARHWGEAPAAQAAGLLPLTIPEVRRLLWHLVWERLPSVESVEHWSVWRLRPSRSRRQHVISKRPPQMAASPIVYQNVGQRRCQLRLLGHVPAAGHL